MIQNRVKIESVRGGSRPIVVDRATTYEITRSFVEPAEARFELGDNGSWPKIRDAIAHGSVWRVTIDGLPWVTGRLLDRRLPVDTRAGAAVQLSVRTRLADAMFAPCDPKINVKRASLKDLVEQAYSTIGVPEITYLADLSRNALTGKTSRGRPPDIDSLTAEEARVHPPETVHAFVERHLNRHGFTQWDGRNGDIVIGAPNDSQQPVHTLRMSRRRPNHNNVTACEKLEVYEDVPDRIWVFGMGGGRDATASKIRASETDPVLIGLDPPLKRSAMVIDQGIKTLAQAEARARREMSVRSRMKDAWVIELDHWTPKGRREPLDINQTVDVAISPAGITGGLQLIWQTVFRGSAQDGHTAQLSTVARGVWRL